MQASVLPQDGQRVILPSRRAEIMETELEGEAILTDPRTYRTHRLNQTAFHVWRGCDGRSTTLQIAESQVAAFEVEFATALDHVEQLVLLLAEADLLTLTVDWAGRTTPLGSSQDR